MTWLQKPKRPRALWTGLVNGLKPNGWTKFKSIQTPTRLKPRSATYAARLRTYRRRARIFLLLNPVCAVFAGRSSSQVHHKFGRRGKLLLDERHWLAVSNEGHDKIHKKPEWARARGYLAPLGQWQNTRIG